MELVQLTVAQTNSEPRTAHIATQPTAAPRKLNQNWWTFQCADLPLSFTS